MEINDLVEGTIENLAFGGKGILRTEGRVIFVPFTAIGDEIICRLIIVKKNFAEAELVEVIKKSSDRTSPPCPYYGTCGGCQLQHLNAAAQLNYKQKVVIDSLQRIGKIQLSFTPSISAAQAMWAYRRHITLSLTPATEGYEAGYIAADGTTLLPIDQCPIFLPSNNSLFVQLRVWLKKLQTLPDNFGRVTLLKESNGQILLCFRFEKLPSNFKSIFELAFQEEQSFAGVIGLDTKTNISIGKTETQTTIEDLTFCFSPSAFIQNHAEQSLNIYRRIFALAKQYNAKHILDLYCGIGISSLLLAGIATKVIGVEGNPHAVALAKKNATANNINNAEFFASDVKKGLNRWLKEFRPELVILNPPRDGLDPKVIELLIKNPPKAVLYISCMPPTLARDLHLLCKDTYEIKSCHLYDMFPQTSHVETLMELVIRKTP